MRERKAYSRRIKRPVTLRIETRIVAYFQQLSQEVGMPYQTLINLYLRECANKRKRPSFAWKSAA